jgi:hypothetical protein
MLEADRGKSGDLVFLGLPTGGTLSPPGEWTA